MYFKILYIILIDPAEMTIDWSGLFLSYVRSKVSLKFLHNNTACLAFTLFQTCFTRSSIYQTATFTAYISLRDICTVCNRANYFHCLINFRTVTTFRWVVTFIKNTGFFGSKYIWSDYRLTPAIFY